MTEETLIIDIPKKSLPYNFDYLLTHYVFYPWVVENKQLVRLFKLDSDKFVFIRVGFTEKPVNKLRVSVISASKLAQDEKLWLVNLIKWMFATDEEVEEFYEVICQKDPVLKTASEDIYGAHMRADPTVFESVIGVIIAQNVFFQRIYEMTELLCKRFGESQTRNGRTYYTFPTPKRLADAPLSDIRACKVGYRDKYIKGVAEKIVKEGLDLEKLKEIDDTEKIRETLISLPGVGPYTADLTIAISLKKSVFHLDLFSREAICTFYFKGKKVEDKELRKFVERKWGKWQRYVMLMLTTNTDTWAKKLNIKFRLKSAAKSLPTK